MTGASGDAAVLEQSVQPLECRLKVHNFSEKFVETQIHFHVLRMADSFFVWIGISPPNFQNLAVAVQNRFERQPLGSSLMGDFTDAASCSLAQKLAKKTNKQVFVSCNLTSNPTLVPLVEKRLFEEMVAYPEKF